MAAKTGESKQGLIISLVICVLLIIILGVVSYYGYAEQSALVSQRKEAEQKESAAKKDRDWYKYRALKMADYAGYLQGKEEKEALDALNNQRESLTGDGKAGMDNVVKTLDKLLAKKDGSIEPFAQRVARLENELKEATGALAAEKATLAKARAEYDSFKETRQKEVDDWKSKYDQAMKDHVAAQQKLAKEYQQKIDDLGDLSKEMAEYRKNGEIEIGKRDKEIKQLKDRINDLQQQRDKFAQKLTPPDLLKFSAPKGKIVRLDPSGEIAWINLGSADNIRPQQHLTFSIFGAGTDGRSTNDVRKGAVEVVKVLEPHFSMAKITEVVEPARNPIMPNDLLINPAWTPMQQEHVALAGVLDLTGDGNDYGQEFMRSLRQQGVVIDAFLDLKDRDNPTIRGDGMSLKTEYLIIGDQPDVDPTKVGSRGIQRNEKMRELVTTMTNEANRLGVSIVPYRRFVQLTGYRLPRGANINERSSYESSRPPAPASSTPKEPAKKDEKPIAKPDKKDNGDKK